ncbi:exonuclease [Candidatus Woesearchaeota archaeon]|nr:MAG: exonuclease [Candidatus Woesearchaeota archaeon]
MIRGSFIFLDKVGYKTERNIWLQGIHSWNDFLAKTKIDGMSLMRKRFYDSKILKAKKNLYNDNSCYFTNILPFSEQYRLYNYFKDQACFLDVETTGYYGDITMVGLYNGYDTKTLVRGYNLNKDLLLQELKKYKLIITYNGASFDFPVIRKYFNIYLRQPHVDLKIVCQKLGLRGGLKYIEKALQIKRSDDVEGMRGEDAVYLWWQWRTTRNRKYLDLLKLYNEEDVINLKTIADKLIPVLWKKIKGCVYD